MPSNSKTLIFEFPVIFSCLFSSPTFFPYVLVLYFSVPFYFLLIQSQALIFVRVDLFPIFPYFCDEAV